MAKIITPAFPVEDLRGKLAGKQELQYANNNNPAYDSPMGQRNYARNYRTCLVACKRAKDGKQYFQIRTKSAIGMSVKSKKAMALLGGAGALYAALLKTPGKLASAQSLHAYAQDHGDNRSFRAFMMDFFRQGLIQHVAAFTAQVAGISLSIDNPWGKFSGTFDISVSQSIRVKFWTQLVAGGIEFSVDGMKGVAIQDDDFATLTNAGAVNYNVLNLTEASSYVKLSGNWVLNPAGEYLSPGASVIASGKYTTTSVAPV